MPRALIARLNDVHQALNAATADLMAERLQSAAATAGFGRLTLVLIRQAASAD